MRTRNATPPHSQVARLQPAWHATAVHEAGHAVAGILLDVPLLEVRIGYQKHGWSSWSVIGRTETVIDGDEPPPSEMTDADLNDAILFVWAGMEAEAMWLAQQAGGQLSSARRLLARSPVHKQGDLASLAGYHRDPRARWSIRKAPDVAHSMLQANWPAVERIAQHLMADHRLGGQRVAQLI